MKKIIIYSAVSLAPMFLFASIVSADVIPPDSHPLTRCITVVNLNDFPDISLIGVINGPMAKAPNDNYQIENGKCLQKGYKLNQLSIYWNTKDKALVVDPKNKVIENLEPYGGNMENSNPLVTDNIEYSIAGFENNKLVLYKSKETEVYNNGTPKKIAVFKSPLENKEITPTPIPEIQPVTPPAPQPAPVKRGFWRSVWCFFGIRSQC